jgi:DNA-nicking Smr family endonuclease
MVNRKKHPSKPPISEDDLKVWNSYIKGVKPLARSAESAVPVPQLRQVETKPALQTSSPALPPDSFTAILSSVPPFLPSSLEYSSRKRLKRPEKFDARLDLHGLTQDQAYHALHQFMTHSINRGARNVLVITGKGVRLSAANPDAGILRRRVPEWLNTAVFKPFITYFAQAHPHDGGSGAFQIRLKKLK